MLQQKSVGQQISELIELQYNGYRGNAWRRLQISHNILREAIGDDKFLAFLQEQEKVNPKPVYKCPLIN